MGGYAKRVIVVGMDGAGMRLVKKMADDGFAPNIAELIMKGAHAYMIGVYPTLTPPGWTSLTTGTWPGTHGVMDFNIYARGQRLDETVWGIDTSLCRAEYVWNLVEKAGLSPIIVKWETSWPPTMKNGVQVEGTGPGVSNYHQVAGYHLFVAGRWASRPMEGQRDPEEVDPSAMLRGGAVDPVQLRQAQGLWSNLPESEKACLEFELTIRPLARGNPRMLRGKHGVPKTYYGLAYASGKDGYDRLKVCRARDGDEAISDLRVGEFSEWWKDTFEVDGRPIQGNVRMKLISLSQDGDSLELFVPQVWPVKGYTYPEEVAEEIDREVGPFLQNPARDALGLVDDETYFQLLDYHHDCLGKVVRYLSRTRPWSLVMVETHASDYANHFFLHRADAVSSPSPEVFARSRRGLERTYASIDGLVGRMMELMDEETVIVLCSDHGGTPSQYRYVDISDVLRETGFLAYGEGGLVDWSRTKAAPVGVSHIFLNLRGREPTGIVPPDRYEETQKQLVDALHGYREPKTGRNPFALALTRADAEMLNLTGELVGDVVYALRPEFDGAHGRQLPTATLGIGGQHSTFILSGAGVRQGVVLRGQVRCVDVLPTLLHLLNVPIPGNVEGRVIYEALEP